MMGIVITSDAVNDCFEIDLDGISADRSKATICLLDIRSVVADLCRSSRGRTKSTSRNF